MKILAIEREVAGVDWTAVDKGILRQEALDVYKMYLTEQLREHYFTESKRAVLVLECSSIGDARDILNKLPLVVNNLISFDVMELHPYTGYDRIIDCVSEA